MFKRIVLKVKKLVCIEENILLALGILFLWIALKIEDHFLKTVVCDLSAIAFYCWVYATVTK